VRECSSTDASVENPVVVAPEIALKRASIQGMSWRIRGPDITIGLRKNTAAVTTSASLRCRSRGAGARRASIPIPNRQAPAPP
jgi:hypothetical protein